MLFCVLDIYKNKHQLCKYNVLKHLCNIIKIFFLIIFMQPGFPPNDSSYTFSPRVTHFVYKCQKGSGYLTHKCQQQLSAGLGWDQTSLAFFVRVQLHNNYFLSDWGRERNRAFSSTPAWVISDGILEWTLSSKSGIIWSFQCSGLWPVGQQNLDCLDGKTVIIIIHFLSFKGPL